MDPATLTLIATAIASAAKAGGEAIGRSKAKKASKLKTKEMKRETQSGLLQDALQRSAELESHKLSTRGKLGQRKAASMQDTADLVRGAFNI